MKLPELTGSSGKPALDEKARRLFLESFEEGAKLAYWDALEEGQAEPVVFMLDLEDEAGHTLGLYVFGEEEVWDVITEVTRRREEWDAPHLTAVLVKAAPYAAVAARALPAFPHLTDRIERISTAGKFALVVSTMGGFSTRTITLED